MQTNPKSTNDIQQSATCLANIRLISFMPISLVGPDITLRAIHVYQTKSYGDLLHQRERRDRRYIMWMSIAPFDNLVIGVRVNIYNKCKSSCNWFVNWSLQLIALFRTWRIHWIDLFLLFSLCWTYIFEWDLWTKCELEKCQWLATKEIWMTSLYKFQQQLTLTTRLRTRVS